MKLFVSYQDFATLLSAIEIALYIGLALIALRRAKFRDRRAFERTETVAYHARYVESPVVIFLLLLAVMTLFAALLIGSTEYIRVAGLTIATSRGFLLILGVWLATWYWRQRVTWL